MRYLKVFFQFFVKFKWTIIGLLSLFLLIPYLWASIYVHPFADDWSFAQKLHTMGRIDFVIDFYNNWSGRYFANTLLSLPKSHPEHSLYMYKLLPSFFILFFGVSVFFLIKSIDPKQRFNRSFALTIFLVAVSVVNFIEPFSALYWNCASFYLPALTFYLFFISFFIRIYIYNTRTYINIFLLLVLAFLVSGLVEVFIFANFIVFGAILAYQKRVFKRTDWLSCGVIFVSLIGLNLSVFQSGVGNRMDASDVQYSFIHAAIRALYDLIIFNIIPVFWSPVILLFILFYESIKAFVNSNQMLKSRLSINPWLVLGTGLLCFYIFHALSIYGAGYSLQGRVQNITQVLFYFFIFILIMVFSVNSAPVFSFGENRFYFISFILVLMMFSNTPRVLITESRYVLPQFDKQMRERYESILTARNLNRSEVVVKAITVNPRTYYLGTYKQNENYYNSVSCLNEMSYCFKIKIRLNRKPDVFTN